jgi:hypothetical protein
MAYAIMVDAGPSEVARFERRGVKIVNLPGPKLRYGDILADTFTELHAHWRDNVISASKVTEEQPLRELLLPRDAQTRLCFFSIKLDRLSLYRSEIFPYVSALGLVPVTADDVISPGDNVNAKIDALIDRAAIMVVEPTTQHTRAELHMALGRRNRTQPGDRRRQLTVIVVSNNPTDLEDEFEAPNLFHIKMDNLTDDPTKFADELTEILSQIVQELGLDREYEPERLLKHGEGRAAVISATTLLETRLRERLWLNVPTSSAQIAQSQYRVVSLRHLLDQAFTQEVISKKQRHDLDGWIKLRNEIVHAGITITKAKAREVVSGVMAIIRGLPTNN